MGRMGPVDEGWVCRPLSSFYEIQAFLESPPAWRSLCEPLVAHSERALRNSLVVSGGAADVQLERTVPYCHVDPDDEGRLVAAARRPAHELPRTLVCHDMANGYHDDSRVDGTGNHEAYSFYHWAGIDIFCYFSHHLVTVPPLGWINVAHRHGVKVIGTVITEWAEGSVFWEDVLSTESKTADFANVLVAVAKTLSFEGWLLNIENKVSQPGSLVAFVRTLHSLLHQELPHAVLLWYDSVTDNGQINWQNQLNEKNKVFFDACDGIFTNYSWTESDLWASVEAAGARRRDLYIGVDVWGRNFYGGGMFNTQQALRLVHKHGCSVAIFAPAWTREAMGEERDCDVIRLGERLSTLQRFLLRDRALWDSLWPFLNTKLPTSLPFHTSFCLGLGKKRRLYGEVICPVPWYNLRHQQYQPNSMHGPHGYLLSRQAVIEHVAGQRRTDKTGIIKYRDQLYQISGDLDSILVPEPEVSAESEAPKELSAAVRGSVESLNSPTAAAQAQQRADQERAAQADREKPKPHLFRRLFKKDKDKERVPERSRSEESVGGAAAAGSSSFYVHSPSIRIRLGDPMFKRRLQLAYLADELPCLETYFDDSFIGGSCIKVNPSDAMSSEHRFIRLFQCEFSCEEAVVVCVVTKRVDSSSQYLVVHLMYDEDVKDDDDDHQGRRAVLVCRHLSKPAARVGSRVTVYPENMAPSFRELRAHLLLNEPSLYVPTENNYGWDVWYFNVELGVRAARISSVNLFTGHVAGPILLGYFSLCSYSHSEATALLAEASSTRRSTGFMHSVSRVVESIVQITHPRSSRSASGGRPPRGSPRPHSVD